MPDTNHRISAAALRRRGLVAILGKGASWSAKLTIAGRKYLEAVDGPNPPIPRRPNVTPGDGIVSDVIRSGGTLKIAVEAVGSDSAGFESRARLAQEQGEVPDGKWLICVRTGDGKELRLIDRTQKPSPDLGQLVPIEIPERVGRYHPKVRRLRDDKARHEVSRAQVPRMVKIAIGAPRATRLIVKSLLISSRERNVSTPDDETNATATSKWVASDATRWRTS